MVQSLTLPVDSTERNTASRADADAVQAARPTVPPSGHVGGATEGWLLA